MFVFRLKHLGVHGTAALAFLAMGTPAPAADRATTIVVSQGSDVLTLDPMLDTSPISVNVFRNIFDALTRIAANGSVTPLLAESWTTSEDTKTWEFKIRGNVTFHNGQPLTVEDVVWSYQRLASEAKSPVRTYINKVKSVEAAGPDKVKFTLSEPFAPFDRQVSLISILPKQAFEQIGAAKFAVEPVGSGPFKVVRWVKDDNIELAAFEQYWGGAPKFKTLIFRPVPSATTRAAALVFRRARRGPDPAAGTGRHAWLTQGPSRREGVEQQGCLSRLRRQKSGAERCSHSPGNRPRHQPQHPDLSPASWTGQAIRTSRGARYVRLFT